MKTNLTDIGSLLIRVSFSISLIIIHGIDKLLMIFEGNFDFPDPLGIGSVITLIFLVVAELICPILIIAGIKVRYAVIPVVMAMLVALFVFHAGDTFEDRELAYVYAMAYIAIGFLGSGKYSVDHLVAEKDKKDLNR